MHYTKENKVYTEHVDIGQKILSTRWICTLKESSEGIRPKARLVARGFEESQINNIPKDSPTCSTEPLRLILTVIAQRGWNVHSMDIKTAFFTRIRNHQGHLHKTSFRGTMQRKSLEIV